MNLRTARPFRLIVDPRGEGRWNMAVDEALLLAVTAGGPPVLRLYGFSPATLSLGRFQPVAGRLFPAALTRDGVTLVRRPTGGQAVLHDEELTYAVALGRDHLEPFAKREIYRFIGGLLLEGLRLLGVAGTVNRHRAGSPYHPDCFGTSGEYEISSTVGEKLIGSAQLVTRAASLQHGAIPLTDSYRRIGRYLDCSSAGEAAPNGPGSLGQALGREVTFEEALAAFREGFRGVLRVEESALSDREREAARRLEMEKYSRDEWNLRL